jgi:hypothetical protein
MTFYARDSVRKHRRKPAQWRGRRMRPGGTIDLVKFGTPGISHQQNRTGKNRDDVACQTVLSLKGQPRLARAPGCSQTRPTDVNKAALFKPFTIGVARCGT